MMVTTDNKIQIGCQSNGVRTSNSMVVGTVYRTGFEAFLSVRSSLTGCFECFIDQLNPSALNEPWSCAAETESAIQEARYGRT